MQVVTNTDKQKYSKILRLSSAHRKGNNPEAGFKVSKAEKFKKIIAHLPGLFEEENASETEGRGLLPVTNNKIDYIYWDDPNELVQRLVLLKASERAGNEGHKAEIASIEEELRERQFIK